MAVFNNPYMYPYDPKSFYQYQQPQQYVPQQQPQTPPTIDWDAVGKACQTLAYAASNAPGGGEYATKADLEKLKKEILEGVKANAKPNV